MLTIKKSCAAVPPHPRMQIFFFSSSSKLNGKGSAIASVVPCLYVTSTQIIAFVEIFLASYQVKSSPNCIKHHVQVLLLSHSFEQILSILPASSMIHVPKSHNLWISFTFLLMLCGSVLLVLLLLLLFYCVLGF